MRLFLSPPQLRLKQKRSCRTLGDQAKLRKLDDSMVGKLFWVLLFLVFTFGFTVLFDHGTENYVENAQKDFEVLKEMVMPSGDAKKKP